MGIVYLAKDPLIGRLVALKTIRAAANADDDEAKEFQQRFIREAQAAGILNHPSIVTVHDIGLDELTNVSFISMEYVEGQNLKEVLAQGRPLPFDQIGDIIAQVAEALDFAHAKGIVHRDVKPANIILVEGNRAKITDFGIAKIATGGNLTTTGQFLGTPNYMAPEQVKGAPVDGRTDIFSLGICLYECLTRRKPFGGDSLTSISYKIVHEPFPPLHEINPQIPDGYEEVVAHALAKDPAKRYQRGREMANALRAVARGEKPGRASDSFFADTMVTHDRERLPTMEMPFPDAEEAPPAPSAGPFDTNPRPPGSQPAVQTAPSPARSRPAKTGPSIFRRSLSPPLFLGIVAVLLLAFVGSIFAIKSRYPKPAPVDVKREAHLAKQRQLRNEAQQLLSQNRVDDAYAKYEELHKLAPNSAMATEMLQRLSLIRQQRQATEQQVAEAAQKFDEGVALYNAKKYDAAAKVFDEAFRLNPARQETVNYLQLSQQQADHERAVRGQQQRPPQVVQNPRPATATIAPTPQPVANSAPAQITTTFNHPFTDGTIVVKVGSDVVAHGPLWEEKGRFSWTKKKVPLTINVTTPFAARNADVQIWVDVPSLKIKEQHTLARQNFPPGAARQLVISFDNASKQFNYQLN